MSLGVQYLASWLRGVECPALYNLMEDAATAEISRSQVRQWVRHGARLKEGPPVTRELVRKIEEDELGKLRAGAGEQAYARGRYDEAAALFQHVALGMEFIEFLTLPGSERIRL